MSSLPFRFIYLSGICVLCLGLLVWSFASVFVCVFQSLREASSVTTPGPPLASAVSVFLFPSFVTRSNLSILRDGVLPLGRVVSLGLFLVVRVLTAFSLGYSSYSSSSHWFPSSPFAPG